MDLCLSELRLTGYARFQATWALEQLLWSSQPGEVVPALLILISLKIRPIVKETTTYLLISLLDRDYLSLQRN
jgi:hypothetical protein